MLRKLFLNLLCVAQVLNPATSSALAQAPSTSGASVSAPPSAPTDYLIPSEVRLIINSIAADPRIQSKDFDGLVDALRALDTQASTQPGAASDTGGAAPPPMTDAQRKAYISAVRKSL